MLIFVVGVPAMCKACLEFSRSRMQTRECVYIAPLFLLARPHSVPQCLKQPNTDVKRWTVWLPCALISYFRIPRGQSRRQSRRRRLRLASYYSPNTA